MTSEDVLELLRALGFPLRYLTNQTASTLLALADARPRTGLLSDHSRLSEGARIHDILDFVRQDLQRAVAENTRESYRKTSLQPLCEAGFVIRHQITTNDPNTYYRLSPEFARLLELEGSDREQAVERLRRPERKRAVRRGVTEGAVEVRVTERRTFSLSPGPHSELERAIVEILARALLPAPRFVFLGDTTSREGFQDRRLMRRLNLPIDLTTSLPDVIVYDEGQNRLLIVEAVASSGPVTEARLAQLQQLAAGPRSLGASLEFLSAFPSRRIFRRFAEQIAWGSSVWIADEPWNIIHFTSLG